MNRNQAIIIIIITLLVTVGPAILVNLLPARNPVGATNKRFAAKAGTERKKTVTLTRTSELDEEKGTKPVETKRKRASNLPTETRPKPKPMTPAQATIQAALSVYEPLKGLQDLEAYLGTYEGLAQASQVYTAMGNLHLRATPPDAEAAWDAFEEAQERAKDSDEKQQATLTYARALTGHNREKEALKQLGASLEENPPTTEETLKMLVLEGQLLEEGGQQEQAVLTYRQAMDLSVTYMGTHRQPGEEMYRLAALRLARLYRAMGQKEASARIRREVRARFE